MENKIKLFVIFDEDGEHICSKTAEKLDNERFLDGSRKEIEQYQYTNDLPTNPMHINLVVYDTEQHEKETDEWFWYSFITRKFYREKKEALEEEEK